MFWAHNRTENLFPLRRTSRRYRKGLKVPFAFFRCRQKDFQYCQNARIKKEFQDLTHRLEVARLLSEGKVFNEISKLTGASSATITRVNKCLVYGAGGYKTVLEKNGNFADGEVTEER